MPKLEPSVPSLHIWNWDYVKELTLESQVSQADRIMDKRKTISYLLRRVIFTGISH
jgi:hypothetical protein